MKNIQIITNYFYSPTESFLSWAKSNLSWIKLVNGGNTYPLEYSIADTHANLNWSLNEITALFSVVDNMQCLGNNVEVIGLQNYRRVFNKNDLEYLDSYDGLIANRCSTAIINPTDMKIMRLNVSQQYALAHNAADFDKFCIVCSKFDWYTTSIFKQWCSLQYLFAPYNTFCFNKNIFTLYINDLKFFINNILQLISIDEVSKRDDYQRRAFAFLCERFLSFWSYTFAENYSFKEVNIEFHKDWKPNQQADIRGEYKRQQYVK